MKKLTLIAIIAWIAIWVNFIARDLFVKGYFKEYATLALQKSQGKASFTYGKRLFDFLNFCKESLPQSADYDFVGIKEPSIAGRRAIYYLYPHVKKRNARFLLVFEKPGFTKKGFKLFKKLDNSRFILKRM